MFVDISVRISQKFNIYFLKCTSGTHVSTTYVTYIMDSVHMAVLTALKETVVNCQVF